MITVLVIIPHFRFSHGLLSAALTALQLYSMSKHKYVFSNLYRKLDIVSYVTINDKRKQQYNE